MILHLIPRSKDETAPKRSIRVDLEPGFTIHSACAFEMNETVELYTTGWECAAISSGIDMYVFICVHVCVYVYIYACMYVYICVFMHVHI
jgi:hypothetical protein